MIRFSKIEWTDTPNPAIPGWEGRPCKVGMILFPNGWSIVFLDGGMKIHIPAFSMDGTLVRGAYIRGEFTVYKAKVHAPSGADNPFTTEIHGDTISMQLLINHVEREP